MDENCRGKTKKINYAGIFKKIDDIPDLRIELENIFDSKNHEEMVKYSVLLGKHILKITSTESCEKINDCFDIIKKWQNGETGKGFAKFQAARDAANKLLKLAHDEEDPTKIPRRRAAGDFCSPGELHFGFNTLRYAAEPRTRNIECAEGIKPYGSNKYKILLVSP
ncbi:MAG: hypothetical protein Ta2B_08800 [Termitinemataceae bacterium]|nr:MAG: hypothetical protein Ta2B_08800 [Termitinemataceae bacterium]